MERKIMVQVALMAVLALSLLIGTGQTTLAQASEEEWEVQVVKNVVWCDQNVFYTQQPYYVHLDESSGMYMSQKASDVVSVFQYGTEHHIYQSTITSNLECFEDNLYFVESVGESSGVLIEMNVAGETDPVKGTPVGVEYVSISNAGQVALTIGAHLYLTDLTTSNVNMIGDPSIFVSSKPSWSPDGNEVIFANYHGAMEMTTYFARYIVSHGVMSEVEADIEAPRFLSDGGTVFVRNSQLVYRAPDGSEQKVGSGLIDDDYSWASEQNVAAFNRFITAPIEGGGSTILGLEICVVEIGGTETCVEGQGMQPIISPDGTQIASIVQDARSSRVEVTNVAPR